MTPMAAELPATRGLRPGTPHCRLHAGFWLLAAVDPLGATVELAGPQTRRLTIPVLIGRDFFCRRFTFSQVSAFHPNPPDRPFRTRPYTLVTPPAILIPPSDRLSSQLQPGISSLPGQIQPRGIPNIQRPPLRQALYLGSPPSSASLVHHTSRRPPL